MNVALLFWFVAFVPFLPFTIQSGNLGPNCPCNQTATECTPCDQLCNQPTRFCTAICRRNNTCQCDNGYLRMDANSNRCVLEKDCPVPKPTCPRNQTATECTPCDQFCNQEGRACTKICIKNSTCGCDAGYLRVDPNSNRCVLKKDCPAPKPTCPRNQTATECRPCDQICNQEGRACAAVCIPESTCRCDAGYLRADASSNRCVMKKDCPAPNSCSPPKKPCGPGEKYTTCGSCDGNCTVPNPACTLQCRVGCYCAQGNVRISQGMCVPKWKCPKN